MVVDDMLKKWDLISRNAIIVRVADPLYNTKTRSSKDDRSAFLIK